MFTVRAGERSWVVTTDPRINYGFPLQHLYEHRETGDPVDLNIEQRDETIVAVSIRDASRLPAP
jgi:hypothetical protein